MRKSISVAFFSLVSTLMVLGIVLMGASEWVLFKNYFAKDRYETLDQVVGVTQRTAQLRLYLTKEGYQVTVANDGEEGLEKFNQVKPDMVLLDVMMPKMDGLEVCRRIRKAGNTPVMMLTAKGETFDKVLGLELGADDYMVKPFDAKEVVARIKAVLRRCQTTTAAAESTEGVIEFDNLRLDLSLIHI